MADFAFHQLPVSDILRVVNGGRERGFLGQSDVARRQRGTTSLRQPGVARRQRGIEDPSGSRAVPDDSVASKTPRADGASAVDGAASYRRVTAGWDPRVCTPTSAGSATPPLLLFCGGFGGTWVVLRRYSAPLPQVIPTRVRRESRDRPIVPTWGRSCRGSRDEVSRHCGKSKTFERPRLGVRTSRTDKTVPTLTRFTPGLTAGILSLS